MYQCEFIVLQTETVTHFWQGRPSVRTVHVSMRKTFIDVPCSRFVLRPITLHPPEPTCKEANWSLRRRFRLRCHPRAWEMGPDRVTCHVKNTMRSNVLPAAISFSCDEIIRWGHPLRGFAVYAPSAVVALARNHLSAGTLFFPREF